jgi:PIN domain nuclease of toxin-antitoxin system
LTDNIKTAYKNQVNDIFLSLVSIWEIQLKSQLGKLHLEIDLQTIIKDNIHSGFIKLLPIKLNHVLAIEDLPFHHKDPFDRLLIAQAIQEDMTIISLDSYFKNYSVKLWS